MKEFLNMKDENHIDMFRAFIGKRFPVRDFQWSWNKYIIITDELEITDIRCDVELDKNGLRFSRYRIYSNYYIEGKFKFNAWASLRGVKKYIKNHDENLSKPKK